MCFAWSANAQSSFYIGPSASTGMFWLYNKGDYEGVVYSNGFYKFKALDNNMLSFKNYRTGVQFGKVFENSFGFDVDIAYQRCYQEYSEVYDASLDESIISDIKYLSLCLSPSFSIPKKSDRVHFSIMPGLSISQLLRYDLTRFFIVEKSNTNSVSYEKSSGDYKSYSNGVLIASGNNESRYNKILLGTHLKLNTSVSISDRIDLVVSLFSQHMITNTDNLDAKIKIDGLQESHLIWRPDAMLRYNSPRSKSHNIYCGMGLSVVYKFGDRY
jgi:hypothetical protein